MAKFTPALQQALQSFDAAATAPLLERSLASNRSAIEVNTLYEFLMWPLLGTAEHGLPVISTASRNPHNALVGSPEVVVAHFSALSGLVFGQMRDAVAADKTRQRQTDHNLSLLWGAVSRWVQSGPEAQRGARASACADMFIQGAPHMDRRTAQNSLNALVSIVQSGVASRLAFFDRLTQADGLDTLARTKTAFFPFDLVVPQVLALTSAMLDGGSDKDKDERPMSNEEENARLLERQTLFLQRVLSHPAGSSLLRLDLTPTTAAESLLKNTYGSTSARTVAFIKAVRPLYAEKGKDAFVNALNSLLTGPELESALERAHLEDATAFFREHQDFKPAQGWADVLDKALQGAMARAARSVAPPNLPVEERLSEQAEAGAFVAGMLVTLDNTLPPMTLAKALADTMRRWERLMGNARFVDTIAQDAPSYSEDEREDAVVRLKMAFANPFLDTLRQERLRLDVEPEHELRPRVGELLVTLMDTPSPAPTVRAKRRP